MKIPKGSPLNYPPGAQSSTKRVSSDRVPGINDRKNFLKGDEWLDNLTKSWYKFSGSSDKEAVWVRIGSVNPPASELQINIQKFTSSGTYTPTQGMEYCIIEVVGGGGGGGNASLGPLPIAGGAGAGGGSSAYTRNLATAQNVGASQIVTIGLGGTSTASSIGGTGGVSSVGTLAIANGGLGGGFLDSVTHGVSIGGSGGAKQGSGDLDLDGGFGNDGWLSISAGGIGGKGADSYFSQGGSQTASVPGIAGVTRNGGIGSGGNGGIKSYNTIPVLGGIGGKGYVLITEYVNSGD